MPKKRNPYINKMSEDQVAKAEATFFYLQVGEETAEYHGKQTFTKDKAEYLFWELMDSMRQMVEEGNAEDQRIARYGLLNFRVHALRIH